MVLFDLDGVLVDSRAAFLNSMTLALTDLELPSFTREQLLPCIGPPLKVGFSGLLADLARGPPGRRADRRLPRALRDHLAHRHDGRARHAGGARSARSDEGGRDLQAAPLRRAAADRAGPARALRGRRRPGARHQRRDQGADDHPRARSSSARPTPSWSATAPTTSTAPAPTASRASASLWGIGSFKELEQSGARRDHRRPG